MHSVTLKHKHEASIDETHGYIIQFQNNNKVPKLNKSTQTDVCDKTSLYGRSLQYFCDANYVYLFAFKALLIVTNVLLSLSQNLRNDFNCY